MKPIIIVVGLVLAGLALGLGSGVVSAARSNDDLKQATRVHAGPFSVAGLDTVDATTEAGEPQFTCAPVSQTVWYRVDVNSTGTYEFDTSGSTYDTVLSVFASDGKKPDFGTLRPVACNDDTYPGLTSHVAVSLEPGTYFVQIGDFGSPSPFSPHLLNLTAGAAF